MLDVARFQWDDGVRRLESLRSDPPRYRQVATLVDAVADQLRRRVGQTFTLAELAAAYPGAEEWVRETVVERVPPRDARVGVGDAALVLDAAFGTYARGATDYTP
jgi:hypothetical protein